MAFLALAGMALQAIGTIREGQAAEQRGKYQAAVLGQQAEQEENASALEESDFRRETSRRLASARAIAGATGTQLSGSTIGVISDMAGEAEKQAMRIRSGGELAASRIRQQGTLAEWEGKETKKASYSRTGANLLKGSSQFAAK